jgi:hypothetical protein
VAAEVHHADDVQGAAREHARQAAPQAVPHCRRFLLLLFAGVWLLMLCLVRASGTAGVRRRARGGSL